MKATPSSNEMHVQVSDRSTPLQTLIRATADVYSQQSKSREAAH